MNHQLRIGVIGDFNPDLRYHVALNEALSHAARAIPTDLDVCWLPTDSLNEGSEATLDQFDALWCAPWSPYKSMAGALSGIRFARERGRPFVGT